MILHRSGDATGLAADGPDRERGAVLLFGPPWPVRRRCPPSNSDRMAAEMLGRQDRVPVCPTNPPTNRMRVAWLRGASGPGSIPARRRAPELTLPNRP